MVKKFQEMFGSAFLNYKSISPFNFARIENLPLSRIVRNDAYNFKIRY